MTKQVYLCFYNRGQLIFIESFATKKRCVRGHGKENEARVVFPSNSISARRTKHARFGTINDGVPHICRTIKSGDVERRGATASPFHGNARRSYFPALSRRSRRTWVFSCAALCQKKEVREAKWSRVNCEVIIARREVTDDWHDYWATIAQFLPHTRFTPPRHAPAFQENTELDYSSTPLRKCFVYLRAIPPAFFLLLVDVQLYHPNIHRNICASRTELSPYIEALIAYFIVRE